MAAEKLSVSMIWSASSTLAHVNLSRIAAVVRAGFHHSRYEPDEIKGKVSIGRGFLSTQHL